ncbi:DUF5798 family protein [Halorubrum xinjiangense]|uniref:DUF5798 family protein n=1 Tax=Halorubrum xinjiangense TaxID=261291 RepID=UPI003C6F1302
MGFGDTAKKIQTLADRAERTYKKISELRDEVDETQETVIDTSERVKTLENEMAEQRAVLDAVAEEVGVDLERVSTEAHITDAEESAAAKGGDADADAADDTDADADATDSSDAAEEDAA